MTDWTVDVYPAYPPLRSSPLLSCLLCLLRVSASSLSARLGPFGVFRWRLEFSLVLSHACSGTLLPPSSLTSFSFLSSLPSLPMVSRTGRWETWGILHHPKGRNLLGVMVVCSRFHHRRASCVFLMVVDLIPDLIREIRTIETSLFHYQN